MQPFTFSNRRYALSVSIAFSLLLLLVRIAHTGSLQYAFLAWNLVLAAVPFQITRFMLHYRQQIRPLPLWALCFLAWLLFLPNAPYILTDLYHLPTGGAPMWYDLILILSFAWNGLLLGFMSLKRMQGMFLQRFPEWPLQLFIVPVMLLCGWGVYIGRYLRWNSWDIVTSPFPLLYELAEMVLHPLRYAQAWGFSLCMGIFMSIVYNLRSAARQ